MLQPLAVPLQGDETADLRLGAAYSSPPVQFLPLVKLSTDVIGLQQHPGCRRRPGPVSSPSSPHQKPLLVLPFYHRHFIGESIQTLEKTLT